MRLNDQMLILMREFHIEMLNVNCNIQDSERFVGTGRISFSIRHVIWIHLRWPCLDKFQVLDLNDCIIQSCCQFWIWCLQLINDRFLAVFWYCFCRVSVRIEIWTFKCFVGLISTNKAEYIFSCNEYTIVFISVCNLKIWW